MLASLADAPLEDAALVYEPKYDGVTTHFDLGQDVMPIDFGSKTIFNYYDLAFELGDTVNRALMVGDFGSNSTTYAIANPKSEFIKYFYGIGTGHGKHDNQHVRGKLMGVSGGQIASSSAKIRGWKYGMMNGFSLRSGQIFRRDHFGQPRDMLEQRLDAKFFDELGLASDGNASTVVSVKSSPVQVKFYDSAGNQTDALKTLSSNVSFEATSSQPYTDGVVRNRVAFDTSTLNITRVVL